jgi:uncharacterized membrane protein
MRSDISPTITRPRNHAIVRALATFPIACFTFALFTDLAYAQTVQMMWADFSAWLLAVGMAGGVVTAVAGLLVHRRRNSFRAVWPVVIGSVFVLVVAFINNLVHSRDAWSSVMPTGLALSCVTVLLMLTTAVLAARASGQREVVMPYGEVS